MSEPTYADVAKWLPTDVREAIESALPCPVSGEAHRWVHDRTAFHQWGKPEPAAVVNRWRCRWCELVHTTDPEPVR